MCNLYACSENGEMRPEIGIIGHIGEEVVGREVRGFCDRDPISSLELTFVWSA